MVRMRGKNLCAFGAFAALSSSAFAQTADPAVHTAPYLVDASQVSS